MTVFLHAGVNRAQATDLADLIGRETRAGAEAISPEQGMAQFRAASGLGEALDLFEENPLPWVLRVVPAPADGESLGQAVAAVDAWLQNRPEVDLVQVDFKWLQRLAGLLALGDAVVTVLALMFSLAVAVVVANTIRLDVANRAEEIQVLSLVGAGNSFIRQPFLYSGFWYGLLGAALALLLFNLSLYYLKQPLERLLDSYGNTFTVRNLGWAGAFAVLLAGGFLGLAGAWISVRRYLRQLKDGGLPGRQ